MRFLPSQQAVPPANPRPGPQLTPEMQELLNQLKDIQEPAPIGWWPPAPGWWITAGIVISLVVAAALVIMRLRQIQHRKLYRTEGARLVNAVDTAAPRAVEEINTLLKRVAVVTFGRRRCAALTGRGWVDFLQETGQQPMPDTAARALTESLYTSLSPAESDVTALQQYAVEWVRSHRADTEAQPLRTASAVNPGGDREEASSV
ncbi:DUF4381 domain-containing protein [Microbulbifer bruguierae]|uniref:DUF4381 domain-containing protein n=1 Tax=Microbulbifer bruguierae TaxID=3029061 RepID=A0ABY8NED6_9GAMM|nr:DUF4381 domain-containing protein [Microbulbifer bruguierae]WGL17281.1 DUF4381 domain-containing protein [Microbulbifer bruguierae]